MANCAESAHVAQYPKTQHTNISWLANHRWCGHLIRKDDENIQEGEGRMAMQHIPIRRLLGRERPHSPAPPGSMCFP